MARSRRSGRQHRVREAAAPRYPASGEPPLAGVLYDSDVIIEILRGRAAIVVAARALERSGTPTYCSPIAWAEVFAGIRPAEEPPTLAFLAARGDLTLDARVGRLAGSYLARYARSHRLEIADALVAAAAVLGGLRLWTRNRKHYPMPDIGFFEPHA